MKRKLFYISAALIILLLGIVWVVEPTVDKTVLSPVVENKQDREGALPQEEKVAPEERQQNNQHLEETATENINDEDVADDEIDDEIDEIKVMLSISGENFEIEVEESSNVIELLNQAQDEGLLTFETKTYSGLGEFVSEINGVAGEDGYYWFLYINGTSSQVGASQYELMEGDSIEWRYEKQD